MFIYEYICIHIYIYIYIYIYNYNKVSLNVFLDYIIRWKFCVRKYIVTRKNVISSIA